MTPVLLHIEVGKDRSVTLRASVINRLLVGCSWRALLFRNPGMKDSTQQSFERVGWGLRPQSLAPVTQTQNRLLARLSLVVGWRGRAKYVIWKSVQVRFDWWIRSVREAAREGRGRSSKKEKGGSKWGTFLEPTFSFLEDSPIGPPSLKFAVGPPASQQLSCGGCRG